MDSLFFRTIIKEEEPTVNQHLYRRGSLQKIKDKLQESIKNKNCYVTIGHHSNPIESLKQSGNIAGIVKDIEIKDGQGVVEVEPLEESLDGGLLKRYNDSGVNMVMDFRVQSVLEDDNDGNGNYYVSMDDFNVENVLAVVMGEN